MVLQPGREEIAKRIFDKYELDFAIIGRLTTTGNLTLKRDGKTLIEIPVNVGVTVGAITALVAPLLLGVGAIAAVVSKVTIVVERPPQRD